MSHHGKPQKEKADGKTREARSSYFRKPEEASQTTSSDKDETNVSAEILSELQKFRQENNDNMMAMTAAITSLEHSVENMGERLTNAEVRINQVEEDSARSSRLLGYLLRRERQLEERCEELENFTRRNNLRVYGVLEGTESGDVAIWTEAFLKELLDLPTDCSLQIERAHRSLQQRPTEEASPRSLIVRFVNHQQKQQVLSKAWSMKNVQFKGKRIYMDHDYSPALQKKRREYADIKKQLKEKNIRFQTPFPAKLKVHLKEGVKTYNSAWEAAEDLLPFGIKVNVSEDEKMDKELNRIGWQTARNGRRGELMTRNLIQDVAELQKGDITD